MKTKELKLSIIHEHYPGCQVLGISEALRGGEKEYSVFALLHILDISKAPIQLVISEPIEDSFLSCKNEKAVAKLATQLAAAGFDTFNFAVKPKRDIEYLVFPDFDARELT